MAQSDITTTCAALVLAGGSSDNPLARHRALPALEIGAAPAALPPPLPPPSSVRPLMRRLPRNRGPVQLHAGGLWLRTPHPAGKGDLCPACTSPGPAGAGAGAGAQPCRRTVKKNPGPAMDTCSTCVLALPSGGVIAAAGLLHSLRRPEACRDHDRRRRWAGGGRRVQPAADRRAHQQLHPVRPQQDVSARPPRRLPGAPPRGLLLPLHNRRATIVQNLLHAA